MSIDAFTLESLEPLVAVGGNSRAARSARAKLQWRDRFGRFVEMGRGIKFKVRFPNGKVSSVIGQFVGSSDTPGMGQVFVSNDPNGLRNGFYEVSSSNGGEILGTISDDYLASKGIRVGYGADGKPVGPRNEQSVQDATTIVRRDAPLGWKTDPLVAGGYVTDDGDFKIRSKQAMAPGAKPYFQVSTAVGDGRYRDDNKKVENIGQALGRVDELEGNAPGEAAPAVPDNKPTQADLDTARAKVLKDHGNETPAEIDARVNNQAGLEVEARRRQQELADIDVASRQAAKDAVAPYDTDGSTARLLDAGAPQRDVIQNLRNTSPQYKADEDRWRENTQADFLQGDDRAHQKKMEALFDAVSLNPETPAPQQNDNNTDAPATPERPGQSILDQISENGEIVLDLNTGDVAQDGFLVPTDNNGQDIPEADFFDPDKGPDLLASYVYDHRDAFSQGGMRLAIWHDPDNGNVRFDAVEQVATPEEARARGHKNMFDVANNELVSTGEDNNEQSAPEPAPEPAATPEPAPEREPVPASPLTIVPVPSNLADLTPAQVKEWALPIYEAFSQKNQSTPSPSTTSTQPAPPSQETPTASNDAAPPSNAA